MRNGAEIILFIKQKLNYKRDADISRALGKESNSTINSFKKQPSGGGNMETYLELASLCKISVSELIDDEPHKIVSEEPSEYKTADPYEMWMAHLLYRWKNATDDLKESIEGGLKSTFGESKSAEIIAWLGKAEKGGGREKDGRKRSCQ
jgi:hypothetical protein